MQNSKEREASEVLELGDEGEEGLWYLHQKYFLNVF